MTRKEAERQTRQLDTLLSLGFTREEAESLRRISMTLRRWFEQECGDSNAYGSWGIERDEKTGVPYRVSHSYPQTTRRTRIADRETGARKRLAAIIDARNCREWEQFGPLGKPLGTYVQTDPRGAALYILRPGDVPSGGDVSAYYNRGICVY